MERKLIISRSFCFQMMVSGVSEVTTQRDGPEWSCSGLMNSIVQDRRDRENSSVQDRRDRDNSIVQDS